MMRGDIYRVRDPERDPKRYRSFVVVSRQSLIDSQFSTVICAPIFSSGQGLSTQVPIGVDEGMKHDSWIICDNLVSIGKSELSQFVGALSGSKIAALDKALRVALSLEQREEYPRI
jgi:mRNA interferase MazF